MPVAEMMFKVEKENGLHDVYEARPDGILVVSFKGLCTPSALVFENMHSEATHDIPDFLEFNKAA